MGGNMMNMLTRVKQYFDFDKRKATFGKEILGGIVTFLAMIYILPVNSFMLANTGMSQPAVFVATALAAGLTTILMGVWGKIPVALAPGMGLNAFFTYTIVLTIGFTYQEALAAVFVSGILFVIISLTGIRQLIIKAMPKSLKIAIGVGIGFFIAFIGFKNAGIIVADPFGTYVKLGDLSIAPVFLALFGIALVFIFHVLSPKVSRFAIILAMVITATVGALVGIFFPVLASQMPVFTTSNTGSLAAFGDLFGQAFVGLSTLFNQPLALPIILTLLFVDFFDTAGTLVSVSQASGLTNESGVFEKKEPYLVDAIGTVLGAVLGTSTVTSYIESNTGIQSGARTGFSSLITGLLFLIAIFLYPLFGFVDAVFIDGVAFAPVTSLALVYVGVLMMQPLQELDLKDPVVLISSFLTIIMMLLTFKISEGIAFGTIAYALLSLFTAKRKDVHWIVYALGIFFLLYFVIEFIFVV
jgi:AGZA family xanthine/uracil permease-like MFS transporter